MIYVISTPIGNLQDITLRAIETLRLVDLIACEDTRVTVRLLNHLGIQKELRALNAFNELAVTERLLQEAEAGKRIGLVSDAGTPAISDPGVRLIAAAIRRAITVVPVPGASSLLAALAVCGLPADRFVFEGFLPQKKGRQKLLQQLAEEERTIVCFESVYRIKKLLEELNTYMPERIVVTCRELTKVYEEFRRGTAATLLQNFSDATNKGEYVVILAPKTWKE